MNNTISLERLHRALGGDISQGKYGPQVSCPGPGHSHRDRSLAVAPANNADGFIVYSHSKKDDWITAKDYVREKLGLPRFESRKSKRREVAWYDYADETGSLLFQKVRYEPKHFVQRRPDGKGDWSYKLGEVRRVLYRLPELIEALAKGNPVFTVEGEKAADSLWALNVPATCGSDGAGTWRDEYSEHFQAATVYVLPDNDEVGRDHAQLVARALIGVGASVRIVELTGLPERGDIYDWLKAGGTADKLYQIAEDAPEYSEDQSAKDDLASIFTFIGDAPAAPPHELIKKLTPAEGVVVTGGQSSAGKTFVQVHKAICLATGIPYFDHKIVERVGTAFIAAEGRPLMPNRFEAALNKLAVTEKLPICWPKLLPDFSSPEGVNLFIQKMKQLDKFYQDNYGVRLGHIVVDTVAATFSMKDEDDNAEVSKVCNVMRRIGEEVGALMAPVHHYGKNPESGLRGASAWRGSADVIEGVLADIDPLSGKVSNRELVCAKARDGEQGPLSPFDLEFITLGMDADGDIYGSLCVVPSERVSKFDKGKAPSKGQRTILDAIHEAMDTSGKIITPRAGMAEVRAVKVSDVRIEFDRRYVVPDTDPAKAANAKRMAFKRALDHLSPTQFAAGAAEGADWIWKLD